jgi:hypothetical protein
LVSARLGPGTYKEQFAFIYRIVNKNGHIVSPKEAYLYEDKKSDFERPPFIVTFKVNNSSLNEFGLVNVHLRPAEVYNESIALKKVAENYLDNHSNKNLAIMGDFNFDCSYISGVKRDKVREILKDFKFYISDDITSSIYDNGCSLDRILVRGQQFHDKIINGSNKIFRYDLKYDITDFSTVIGSII